MLPHNPTAHIGPPRVLLFAALCTTVVSCGYRAAAVAPEEIPSIEQELEADPQNGDLMHRYAAALFAAGRCDSAMAVSVRASSLDPADALGPLIRGQCYEQRDEFDAALDVYRSYLDRFPGERGVGAVRAREMLALRADANRAARAALDRESELADTSPDPAVVAVLPLDVAGDSVYQPLSRGLAQMIISDLDLIQRFRLVERLRVSALLDEMNLQEAGAVDPSTAARVGHLIQAGRMVQGLVTIPEEADVRLEASVVASDGEVTSGRSSRGRLRDLLRLEKELVIEISNQLGYTLSQAERQAVLENGTQNLAAFLAYSRGILAEDLGDFQAAAAFYAEAVQRDPGFGQARRSYSAARSAPQAQSAAPGEVTRLAASTDAAPEPAFRDPTVDAVRSTVGDLASLQSEQLETRDPTQQVVDTPAANPPPSPSQLGDNVVRGTIRIIFRIP